jgi:hypothetical protein
LQAVSPFSGRAAGTVWVGRDRLLPVRGRAKRVPWSCLFHRRAYLDSAPKFTITIDFAKYKNPVADGSAKEIAALE